MEELLIQKVNAWADRNQVLKPETTVIVGVSGGADSVCLLHVLYSLQRTRYFSILAAHINHMLRGEEADQDENFVKDLCNRLDIPLRVFHEDVKAYADIKGCSVEEAGRNIRYAVFHQILKEVGAQYIAVAHHSQDQAETIFLHLLRGSGLDGLCGMKDITDHILRPFLNINKEEIEDYLCRNNLAFQLDSSNLVNFYTRNTVRNLIFPKIQTETGFPITRSLLRTAKLLQSDQEFLEQVAWEQFQSTAVINEEKTVEFNRERFNQLHPAIRGRVIRMGWQAATGSIMGIEEKHIASIHSLASAEVTGKSIDLPKGFRAMVEYNRLILTGQRKKQAKGAFSASVPIPSNFTLPQRGLRISTRIYERENYEKVIGKLEKPVETSLTQLFDYDRVNEGINIRSRIAGDHFFPYHSPGNKKLKDFFIDEKIPQNQREDIPLLADGKNIIWVIGLRTSEKYKITETTSTILCAEVTSRKTFTDPA